MKKKLLLIIMCILGLFTVRAQETSFFYDFEDGTLNGLRVFSGESSNAPLWAVGDVGNGTGIFSMSYNPVTWITYADVDNYVVTENQYQITENSVLSWYLSHSNPIYAYADVCAVVVSEDGETFTTVEEYQYDETDTTKECSLAAYAGKNLYVGFRHYCVDEFGGESLILDDIKLSLVEGGEEPTPEPEPVAPAAPTNVVATADGQNSIIVTWDAVDGASEYNIYHNEELISVTNTTSDTIEGLTESTEYCFAVTALFFIDVEDETYVFESELSETVCATTESLQENQVIVGTATTKFYSPFLTVFSGDSWFETIYKAEEIGKAGNIAEIAFSYKDGAQTTADINIYLSETTKVKYSSSSDLSLDENLTLVYSGTGVTLCDSAWETFVLDTPFNYSGENNLLLVVTTANTGLANNWNCYIGDTNTVLIKEFGFDTRKPVMMLTYAEEVVPTPVAPTAPVVVVDTVTETTVTLTWAAVEGATSYNVYVGEAEAVSVIETTYTATDLTPATEYTFTVTAVNEGGESFASNLVKVTTEEIEGPEDPDLELPEYDFIVNIGSGDTMSSSLTPYYGYYEYSVSQQIYTAEEIGVDGGIIKSIAFKSASENTATRNISVFMKNTTKDYFESDTDWIDVSESDLVYEGPITTTGIHEWCGIELTEEFVYGGDNILLFVVDNTGQWSGEYDSFYIYLSSENTSLHHFRDGNSYDPYDLSVSAPGLLDKKNYIQFTFAGINGPMPTEFFYDFEDLSLEDWTTIDADGDGHQWLLDPTNSTLVSYSYNGGYLYPDNYIFTTSKYKITEMSNLSFSHTCADYAYNQDKFAVVISEDGINFNIVWEYLYTEDSNSDWENVTIDLSSYAGKALHIGFRHFDCNGEFGTGVRIDNIKLATEDIIIEPEPTAKAYRLESIGTAWGNTAYTYDEVNTNTVVSIEEDGILTEVTYNEAGQIASAIASYEDVDEDGNPVEVVISGVEYEYDENGVWTSYTETSQSFGGTVTSETVLSYDAEGRLVSLTSEESKTEFAYNAEGLVSEKVVYYAGFEEEGGEGPRGWNVDSKETYAYENGNLVRVEHYFVDWKTGDFYLAEKAVYKYDVKGNCVVREVYSVEGETETLYSAGKYYYNETIKAEDVYSFEYPHFAAMNPAKPAFVNIIAKELSYYSYYDEELGEVVEHSHEVKLYNYNPEVLSLPLQPMNLTAEVMSATEVELAWEGFPDAESFTLYQGEAVLAEGLVDPYYTVENLEMGVEYCFAVMATNSVGNSEVSETVCVTIELPAAPVVTGSFEGDKVILEWEAVEGALAYNLYYGGNLLAGPFEDLIVEIQVPSPGEYCFTVTAFNEVGESEYSNEVCVTVTAPEDMEAPAAPVLEATLDGNKAVLSWEEVENATYYDVYIEAAPGQGQYLGTATMEDLPISLELPEHGIYCFYVVAVNLVGESEPSNVACVFVPAPSAPASSLTFFYEGNEITNTVNEITLERDLNGALEIQFDLEISNSTANNMNVVCEMEDLSNVGQCYLCWGSCYMPGITEVVNTVYAGSSAEFNGHVMFVDEEWNELPKGTVIPVRYTFYDESNPSEQYVFNVKFIYENDDTANYWTPDESLYANNMTIITTIEIDGEEQYNTNLELGAFCNGELRGSARLQYVDAPANRYECFLMVYGNSGDDITFRLYDHGTGLESDFRSSEVVDFEVNATVGDVVNPYIVNFVSTVLHSRDLTSGWNWYSTYIVNEGAEGLASLEAAVGTNGIQIKNQTKFVNQASGNWYGTLNSTAVEDMFMIQMSAAHTLNLEGYVVNPADHPITLGTNWKWISYPLAAEMSVEEAFASANPSNGDYVKSQKGFAQYYEGLGWSGTLKTMTPGMGYMYQNTSGYAKTLVYPMANAKSKAEAEVEEDLHWTADATKYPMNMTVIAVVEGMDADYEVAAFCNGECRGSARPVYIEALGQSMIFMTIYGDDNDNVSFRYYDMTTGEEVALNDEMTFEVNATHGDVMEPYVMTLSTMGIDETSAGFNIYPNPVHDKLYIETEAEVKEVVVYDVYGRVQNLRISESQKLRNSIDVSDLNSGVYFIQIKTEEGNITKRFVKE